MARQTTLAEEVGFSGIGVHGGAKALLRVHPASAGSGIVFHGAGFGAGGLRAFHANVGSTDLATVLGDPSGAHVSTIEHLMSALAGLGIDNAVVAMEGAEVPILDGSARDFVAAFDAAGLRELDAARDTIRVMRPVRVQKGDGWAEFLPDEAMRFDVEIDFPAAAIGRQAITFELTPDTYRRDIAPARTFGFLRDVDRLRAAGLALGASLENTVAIGDDGNVVNAEGLRFADEFVRHKALDAIGDLALAGAPIIGCFRSYKGGHALNAMALEALLTTGGAALPQKSAIAAP